MSYYRHDITKALGWIILALFVVSMAAAAWFIWIGATP
jgi:uncharacterized membrane protein